MKRILLTVIVAGLLGCTRPDTATRILEQSGYTHVEITGWRPFAGSDDDMFHTGFKAVSPSGQYVTGVVTGGILKSNTIRLD